MKVNSLEATFEKKTLSRNDYEPRVDPLSLFPRALTKLNSIWVGRTYPFASIGRNVSIHFTSRIRRERAFQVSIGNSVIIFDDAWLNIANDSLARDLPPTIRIEDNCSVGAHAIISARNQIYLERDVLISQSVLIQDHNHAYEDITLPVNRQGLNEGGRIRICQGAWIGRGAAIICPRGELVIGRNAVIGANSVVVRSVPDYSVAAGFPAKVIRQYDPERRAWFPDSA